MKTRHAVMGGLISATLLGTPVISQAYSNIEVRVAPPAPRHEVVPAPRTGYEWAPGYWNWSGNHYVWSKGHYVKARGAGYRWVAPTWNEHDGRYHMQQGRWEHDGNHGRDHDRDHDRNHH